MVTDGDSNCVYDGVNYSQSEGVNYGLVIDRVTSWVSAEDSDGVN